MIDLTFRWLARVVVCSGALLASTGGLAAASVSYRFDERLPCVGPNCTGNLSLVGTITVDHLGTLDASDIMKMQWTLLLGSGSLPTVELNPSNSAFAAFGSQLVATSKELEYTVAQIGDKLELQSNTTAAEWLYGDDDSPAEILTYPLGDGTSATAFKSLPLPSMFAAESLGAIPPPSPAPEPTSLLLMLSGAGLLVGAARRRRGLAAKEIASQLAIGA